MSASTWLRSLSLKSPALWATVAILVGAIGIWYWSRAEVHRPLTHDYACTSCGHTFKAAIPPEMGDVATIECPQCHKQTAQRLTHWHCRACGNDFVLKGNEQANTPFTKCPKCQSKDTDDLDYKRPS